MDSLDTIAARIFGHPMPPENTIWAGQDLRTAEQRDAAATEAAAPTSVDTLAARMFRGRLNR